MEDRFKFRVWFKGAYTYFDFALLNSESTPFYENEIRNSKVEQCTGLKDKNGNLIYESDRLKAPSGLIYTVRWNNKMAHFETDGISLTHPEELKIVGNIHNIS